MNPMCLQRWLGLMNLLGAPGSHEVCAALIAAHEEPHRHYHSRGHVDDCLTRFDEARSLARSPEEVEIALWFHDAVYDPTSSQNEVLSAGWAESFLRSVGVPVDRRERVVRLIMATKHEVQPSRGDDASLVVDIDLSILGRSPSEYDRYEEAIRREYEWVPLPVYQRKRAEILGSFLKRPTIYINEFFRQRYELSARRNLLHAVKFSIFTR